MKKIIVTTCLLATGFLLTACGESQSSNESQQTTIQFMHSSVEQERLSVINELVADFEKKIRHQNQASAGRRISVQYKNRYVSSFR